MYRATLASNITEVRRLQRNLLKDTYARLLSVKRVTSENTGSTPGVDKAIILNNVDMAWVHKQSLYYQIDVK